MKLKFAPFSHIKNLELSFVVFNRSVKWNEQKGEKVDKSKQLVAGLLSKYNCLASHGELTETGTET